MGVFTLEYQTSIQNRLHDAVDNALENEVKDAALQAIEFGAMHEIYMSYTPYPIFQSSRRYSFMQDENYETKVENNTLTITSVTKDGLQDLFYTNGQRSEGVDLGDIVAEGNADFYQPFARPWMDEGVEQNIGVLEEALMNGLHRQGF
jgi:hypothetical protein